MNREELSKKADKVIVGWSFGAFAANLLPPPFDIMAVGSAFAKLGWEIAKVYNVKITMSELKSMGKIIAKGVGAATAAAYVGTGIFKWIPGVNIWVALLLQPPMVAAMSYVAGQSYKKYFEVKLYGESMSNDELKKYAEKAWKDKIGK